MARATKYAWHTLNTFGLADDPRFAEMIADAYRWAEEKKAAGKRAPKYIGTKRQRQNEATRQYRLRKKLKAAA